MKKMTDMITNDVGGDTSFAGANFRCAQDVCYSRVQHVSHTEEPFTLEINQAENRTEEPFTLDTNRAESHTEDPFTLETNRRDIAFDLPRNSPGFVGTEDQSRPNNIFDLDNLDLGPLSMTLEDLQRIGLFDCESIKNMPDMITNDVGGGTSFAGANLRNARDVCYSSVQYESHTEEPFTPETNRADIASDLPRHSPGFVGTEDQHSPTDPMLRSSFIKTGPEEFSNHLQSKYPSLVGNPLATILEEHNANIIPDQHSPINPMLRSSFTEAGPEDFSNYLRSKYPSLVGHPITTILEEHNARVMENITELIDSYQVTMFSFVEELLRSISEKCCCCKASGRTDCLLRSPNATHGNARRTTPKRKSRFCPTETGHHKKTRDMPDGQR